MAEAPATLGVEEAVVTATTWSEDCPPVKKYTSLHEVGHDISPRKLSPP